MVGSSVFIVNFSDDRQESRCSIGVSIPACHAGDPGSIPGNGDGKIYFGSLLITFSVF